MKFDLFVQESLSQVEEFKLEIRNPKSETISNDKNSKQKNGRIVELKDKHVGTPNSPIAGLLTL